MVTPLFTMVAGGPYARSQPLSGPPFLVNLNLVPFKQYISFDSLVSGGGPPVDSSEKLAQLRDGIMRAYFDAVDRNALITSMPPLSGAPVTVQKVAPSRPHVLTTLEADFLASLSAAPKDPTDGGIWVFRRHG